MNEAGPMISKSRENKSQRRPGRCMDIYSDIRVSVIIGTRNRPDQIQHTLMSLLDSSRCPDEIVVLDQSDDDLTKEEVDAVRSLPNGDRIRYVTSKRRGLSANRNDAIREATGDFIASVDDDVAVEKRWLEFMLREWITVWGKRPVLITGRILPAPEFQPGALVTAIRLSEKRTVFEGKPRATDVLIGAQFGASRQVFTKLGKSPFDEMLGVGAKFPGADDEEFAYRVQKAGFPVVYEPSIAVTHYTERRNDWRRVNFKYGVGNGAAMAKHLLRGDIGILLSWSHSFAVNIVKSIKAALRLKEPEASGRLLTSAGLLIGLLGWMLAVVTGRLTSENDSQ